MKKTITNFLACVMIITLAFSLAGCGENPKKQEAIDAFNSTSTSFNEVAKLVNENADVIDDELISVFQDMSALLTEYKNLLEGDTEISDEKYDEMIKWFGTAKDWSVKAKTSIETALADLEK